jgi:hypothetical protein
VQFWLQIHHEFSQQIIHTQSYYDYASEFCRKYTHTDTHIHTHKEESESTSADIINKMGKDVTTKWHTIHLSKITNK